MPLVFLFICAGCLLCGHSFFYVELVQHIAYHTSYIQLRLRFVVLHVASQLILIILLVLLQMNVSLGKNNNYRAGLASRLTTMCIARVGRRTLPSQGDLVIFWGIAMPR